MQIEEINLKTDIEPVEMVIKSAFSQTPDANMDDWFSVDEMVNSIETGDGVCLKATDNGEIVGVVHAQNENPINGREGKEKWVITNLAVAPTQSGKGVGSRLLGSIEEIALSRGAEKMFVHTNQGDHRVIHFYEKNGYKEAGFIKDYYYDGSAVFLLKYLSQ